MHRFWQAVVALALALGLAGCATSSKPPPEELPTVSVISEPVMPPAQPITEAPHTPTNLPPAVSAPATNLTEITAPTPPASLASPRWPSNWVNSWIPLEDWARFNRLAEPVRTKAGVDAVFRVHGSNSFLVLQAGNRAVVSDGQVCWLGFTPKLLKGQLYVHSLDAQKFLQPLLHGARMPPLRTERVLVIDAGHGGRDGGTSSPFSRTVEKTYTLDWALRLQNLLLTNGWKVVMTRTNDADLPLPERIAIADRCRADLFISLHFNAAPDNRALSGIETYCLTPSGLPADLIREGADNVRMVFPNNAYDGQNLLFAYGLQRVLVQATGAKDRGVRHARFMSVLRGQQRPAVLIEGGYLSNAAEARKIALPSYRQTLAEAVARALK